MATVEFKSKEDVKAAIERFDHYELKGREIFVRQDYPPPEDRNKPYESNDYRSRDSYKGRDHGSRDYGSREYGSKNYDQRRSEFSSGRNGFERGAPEPGTEIFVGNIPFSMTWQDLKDLMREAGEVARADVRLDHRGFSKGFGTVVFKTSEEANIALEKFQGYEIEGRQLNTRPGKVFASAKPNNGVIINDSADLNNTQNNDFTRGVSGDGEPSDLIYTENLPFVTSVDDLYELFETVGKVVKADLQFNSNGKTSGNALVQFENQEFAQEAIKNLNGYNYGGRDIKISYAKLPTSGSAANKEGDSNEVEVTESDQIMTED